MNESADVLSRVENLLTRLEALLPRPPSPPDWDAAPAFRWIRDHSQSGTGSQRSHSHGQLLPVLHPHRIRLDDLYGIDEQAQRIAQNTQQFIDGRHANNVLLTGARGTGKSSLVKAMLDRFSDEGLRLIEMDRQDLMDLPEVVALLTGRPERFIIFCDDLSFESGDPGYKALKSVLDGSIAGVPENLLIYATSNRRHLMPEYMDENLETHRIGDEIHPGERVEEKISLSERFGLWLSFYPFDQDHYLAICQYWVTELGNVLWNDTVRQEALQWSLSRGARNGRVAWQFARDWVGRNV